MPLYTNISSTVLTITQPGKQLSDDIIIIKFLPYHSELVFSDSNGTISFQ